MSKVTCVVSEFRRKYYCDGALVYMCSSDTVVDETHTLDVANAVSRFLVTQHNKLDNKKLNFTAVRA